MLWIMGTLVLLVLLAAIVFDIGSMTIPNSLCAFLALAFLLTAALVGMAPMTVGLHVLCGFVVLCFTFAMFAMNWMGGGDAKLIAATAVWFGPTMDLASYILLASVFGGVLTLALLAVRARTQLLPATGVVFLDRLLHPTTGIPYGVALGLAGIIVFRQGSWGALLF